MKNQRKIGAIFSYIATILNIFISIFLTPFILQQIGDVEYGVYRTVQSLTGQLALISIGIGTIMSVMVARYNVREDKAKDRDKENLFAMGISIAGIISLLVILAGTVLFCFIDTLYSATMNSEQIFLVKELYIILVFNVALYLFRDVFAGIIHGYEKFLYSNFLKVLRLILRVALIVILLLCGFRSFSLVMCDLLLTVALLVCDVVYCFKILEIKVKFHFLDKELFKMLLSFSIAVMMQTFVNQVNQNLDGVILGAMVKPQLVTVYSLALTIYVSFNSMSSALASLYTPEAARMVQLHSSTEELEKFVVKVGRYQYLTMALLLGGFISVGENFVNVWVGSGKGDVYYLALILMIPMMYANTLSGANSVLDGYMKRMGRSIILIFTAIINIVFSICMVKIIGYWGAAWGTAGSVILGQIIILSFHYRKVFGFHVIKYFAGISKGITLSLVLAILCSLPFGYIHISDFWLVIIKGIVFVAVYGICIIKFGANENEKIIIHNALKMIKRKKDRL